MPTPFWQEQYRELAARGKKPARRKMTFAEMQAFDAQVAKDLREGVDFSRKDALLKRIKDETITREEITEAVNLYHAGGFSDSESDLVLAKLTKISNAIHASAEAAMAADEAQRQSDMGILTKETPEEPLKPSETIKLKGNENMASLEDIRRRSRELD